MRAFALAAISAALIANPAFASDDAEGKSFTLKVESPGIPERGTVQTDVGASFNGNTPAQRAAQPLTASAAPQDAASATPPLPQIAGTVAAPGQGATAPAATAAPAPAASAAEPSPGTATLPSGVPGQPGLVPGQPVKVYATLAAAAEAGVDPLHERKISVSKPRDDEDVEAGFDWRDPSAYLSILQANEKAAKLGGLGLLGTILLLWLVGRRRR